jgi:hypothetical protein
MVPSEPIPEYMKCRCGCGLAVSPEYWDQHNIGGSCPACGNLFEVHHRHDLIVCLHSLAQQRGSI